MDSRSGGARVLGYAAVCTGLALTVLAQGCGDEIPKTSDVTPPSGTAGTSTSQGDGAQRLRPMDSHMAVLSPAEPVRKYNVASGRIEYRNDMLGQTQNYVFQEY